VPDVREPRHGVAGSRVVAAGLVRRFTGRTSPNACVLQQSPWAGTIASRGDTVRMLLRDTPIP